MEPQLKEDAKTPGLDAQESPELASVKSALARLRAAETRATSAQAKLQEDVDKARREYAYQVYLYNRDCLKPKALRTREEWRRYTEELSRADFYRTCFVRHEGEPKDFPCLVVTVRASSVDHEQVYNHRFLSVSELESLLSEMKQ